MPSSKSRIRINYVPTAAPADAPVDQGAANLLDDDDFDAAPASRNPSVAANPHDYDSDSYSDYSSDDDNNQPSKPRSPPPYADSARVRVATPLPSNVRMDPRLISVMDSGQLMPEVKESMMDEQKYFGNNMSVHDSELARRYSSQAPSSGHMSPLSGAPVEVDDGSASEDDDYDDRRTTADDGYSHATRDDRRTYGDLPRPSAEELKEQQESRTRRAIRVEYRLLHKAGVVSNKNYNIMTTPVALLMDDLEDLRIDSRIDQWTGIVKDVVVYLAQFIEFANYRFLNGRFALQRYGKFMESRIPFLRPKIVRVAGLMVKNGATINPIFDLVLAFAGQTIMFVTMNQITQNMQQNLGALPPAATPAPGPFDTMGRDVPSAQEYDGKAREAFFQGDRPLYNGNVTANTDANTAATPHPNNNSSYAPQNPFMGMMGGKNDFLTNVFNAITGNQAPAGLGEEFRQGINSMLPNNGNFKDFEEVFKQAETDMGGGGAPQPPTTAVAGDVKPPTIVMTHETSSRKRRKNTSAASMLS